MGFDKYMNGKIKSAVVREISMSKVKSGLSYEIRLTLTV